MKLKAFLLLGLLCSTRLHAQPAGSNAPALPPRGPLPQETIEKIRRMTPIFDGKTLDGWIQAPPYATAISGDDLQDFPALARKLTDKPDAVSAFLSEQLEDAVKAQLAEFTPASTNLRAVRSALARQLTRIGSGPLIYDEARFRHVELRPQTTALLKRTFEGQELARVNRLLLEDAYPKEISRSPEASWTVKDGAMASLGAGRGVIYTAREYGSYRVIFTMRHLGGPPGDHAPCVLVFCTGPKPGEKPLDALAGIQFQPPNGGSWDYRPGKNNSGRGLFNRLVRPGFDSKEWHQVELLVNAKTGTARMAVAQPVGTRAIEVLQFNDPAAARNGPLAWQMHNKGLFDEFKDVRIEEEPVGDGLILVGQ